jgi:hypothetical protein
MPLKIGPGLFLTALNRGLEENHVEAGNAAEDQGLRIDGLGFRQRLLRALLVAWRQGHILRPGSRK